MGKVESDMANASNQGRALLMVAGLAVVCVQTGANRQLDEGLDAMMDYAG